jgi:hypothetical protein
MRLIIYYWKRLLLLKALSQSVGRVPLSHRLMSLLHFIYSFWTNISHIKRGIFVGVVIALVTHGFRDAEVFRKMEDAGLDWMISMYRGVPRPVKTDLHPITFLDIDERSFRHWGEPLFIPRDKLLKLISYAVDGKASLVIVDVELSRPSGESDNELKEYLANYSNHLPKPPEILLARGLRFRSEDGQGLFEQRQSFLDDVVMKNPHLHWAAPLYQLEEDAVIRRWRLWEPTCQNDARSGEPHVKGLPSFQLLATTLLKEGNSTFLQTKFQPYLPATCGDNSRIDRRWGVGVSKLSGPKDLVTPIVYSLKERNRDGEVLLGDLKFNLNEAEIGKRILYSLPWRLKKGESYPVIPWAGDPNYPLFSIKPAVVVTEAPHQEPPDLRGHVVIIGASNSDSRDIYSTPINAMPGSMIIVNAFLSFFQNGEVEEPPLWVNFITEVLLIVIVAFVFSHLNGFFAKIVASLITLLLILPVSFFLFRSGLWLDFAIPLAAVEFHAMVGEMEEKLRKP